MSKKIHIIFENTSKMNLKSFVSTYEEYLEKFLNPEEITCVDEVEKEDSVVSVLDKLSIIVPLKELINMEEEIEKLKQQKIKLEAEVSRCKGMLSNPKFVEKAPKEKVDAEKAKLESYLGQLSEVEELLKKYIG